jgi:hypothetical protein
LYFVISAFFVEKNVISVCVKIYLECIRKKNKDKNQIKMTNKKEKKTTAWRVTSTRWKFPCQAGRYLLLAGSSHDRLSSKMGNLRAREGTQNTKKKEHRCFMCRVRP